MSEVVRPAEVNFEFGHKRDAPRGPRRAIGRRVSAPDDPTADRVVVATSRLATNAIQRTNSGGTMRGLKDDDRALPEQHRPTERGGRGLKIVSELPDLWGVETTDGKVEWAEFEHPTP